MRRPLCLCLALGALVSLAAAQGAQGPAGGPAKSPTPGPGKRVPLDQLKLPPGALLVIPDEKDPLKGLPSGVFLPTEAWQELAERLDKLERQLERLLKPERRPPAECRLRATVEGDFARVEAEFVFTTEQPRTTVPLGCRGAQLTDARLRPREGDADLGLPLLDPSPTGHTGYTALIPKAGEYRLTLSLRLPVGFQANAASRGAERSLDFSLPGAAVTTVTLDLPYAVKEIRANKTLKKATEPGGKQKHWEGLAPGAVTSLPVSWQEPVGLPSAGPLLTARGQIVVRLEEQYVKAVAELTLQDLRGRAREWKLWLPPGAEVKVSPPEGITATLLPPRQNVHTLKLNEPTGEPLKVTVTAQQARPFPLPRWPVGPFAVVDAFRQEGTVEVRASATARRGVRLQYVLGADVDEREPPQGHAADLVAFFRYWSMPGPQSPKGPKKLPGLAPLEIELRPARGRVETHVEHDLRLRRAPEGGLKVQVTTRIRARPLGDPVDYLDVQLPRARPEALPSLVAGPGPGPFPGSVPWGPLALSARAPHEAEWLADGAELQFPDKQARAQRRARIRLPFSSKESTVVLKGAYTLPLGSQQARLDLPLPLAIQDAGARVKVEVVDRSAELLVAGPLGKTPPPGRYTLTTELDSAPPFVDLAWRPYRPELPVTIVADVTFYDRDAHVRQEIAFQPSDRQAGDAVQLLQVPAGARGLRATGAWELLAGPVAGRGLASATLRPRQAASSPLVLEYDFVLPQHEPRGRKKVRGKGEAKEDGPPPFEVPLVWPEQATRAQTKVRLWSASGLVPTLVRPDPAELTWKDRGVEVVPDRELPAKVLRADGLGLPLYLRLPPAPPALARAIVARVLVQVWVDERGEESYRVRFLIGKLIGSGDYLDVRLPAASAGLSLKVRLGGRKVTPEPRDGGKVIRVPVKAEMFRRPAILEVSYQLPRNQPEVEGAWQTSLHPPEILDSVLWGQVRWQVGLPGNWVPLVLGSGAYPEENLGLQGWLPGPVPAATEGELEKWLTGAAGDETRTPSLVCASDALAPLRLLRPSRQLWFLACSGLVLLLGLGLSFAPPSHYAFWISAGLLLTGAVTLAFLWPEALPSVLYGCLPGVFVLAFLAGVQWLLHQRYRRQVVFLPGFKRLKSGSSLLRGSSHKRNREPSTVDVPNVDPPPGPGSSLRES